MNIEIIEKIRAVFFIINAFSWLGAVSVKLVHILLSDSF